jgi:hypothetical protein
MPVASKTP